MKALILNSGLGRRMGVLTSEHPKCMTDVSATDSILSRQLRLLAEAGVTEIVMTTGYFDEILVDYCHSLALPLSFTFVKNPIYDKTNYIYSIYCAREVLKDEDILLLHGDIVFELSVLKDIIACPKSCMKVSSTLPLPEKDFKAVTERLLPHVCRIADRCAEFGITALYEPQGFYVNGKERFPEFYRAVKEKCSDVGICGDIGNPYFSDWRGEDFVTEMASEIRHVHLKDYRLYSADTLPDGVKAYTSMNGTILQPVLMGKGDIDIPYCLDTLKKAGYNGALAFESEYRSSEEISEDVKYIRSVCKY